MFKGERKIEQWFLKKFIKLEELIPLLQKDYTEEKDNITLYHKWLANDGISTVNERMIIERKLDEDNIRYLPVYAKLEIIEVDKEYITEVPREVAISHRLNPVLFIERFGQIISIVSAPTNLFSRIRNVLMHSKIKNSQWGSIDYKGLNPNRSFFYWLMYNKNNNIILGKEKFKLLDLTGFKSATEREQHKFDGRGYSIDDQVSVEAMISTDNTFIGLGLVLRSKRSNIEFFLFDNCSIKFKFTSCYLIKGKDQVDYFDPVEIVLKIFLQVIPGLISEYNKNMDEWKAKASDFRKQVGLRAIKDIMEENNISPQDIKLYLKQ